MLLLSDHYFLLAIKIDESLGEWAGSERQKTEGERKRESECVYVYVCVCVSKRERVRER